MNNITEKPEFSGANQSPDDLPALTASPLRKWIAKSGLWALLVVVSLIFAGGWVWTLKTQKADSWSVVFEGRSFDKSSHRQAVLQLTQLGIRQKAGASGEILVAPSDLNIAQAGLEKAGLKPLTFEELRSVSDGPLAILESPAQRDERHRVAKERELAWFIRRFENVAQAHVTIESISGGHRWIGTGEKPRQRVRVFIEPAQADLRLTDETVLKIEKLVLASLPTTGTGQITIHDPETIYVMAGSAASRMDASNMVHNPEIVDRERALADQIRQKVAGLSQSTIRVSLREFDEGPSVAAAPELKPAKAIRTKLVLNQPIEIEMEPAPLANNKPAPAKISKARVQVLTTLKTEDAELEEMHIKAREQIVALIAPAVLDQLDWQTLVAPSPKPELALEAAPVAVEQPEKPPETKPSLPIKPLNENAKPAPTSWIMGGVAIALVLGGASLLLAMRNHDQNMDRSQVQSDQAQKWGRDLAAAVRPPDPHLPMDEAGRAAKVLSSWISSENDEDFRESA